MTSHYSQVAAARIKSDSGGMLLSPRFPKCAATYFSFFDIITNIPARLLKPEGVLKKL